MQNISSHFHVTSSPHIHTRRTVRSIMRDVIIALVPAGAFGVYQFGISALWVILTCVLCAVAAEFLYEKIARRPITVGDLSAIVTGLLLAYNLPSSAPLWMCAIGSVLAIVLVKQIFGGIGQNFMNPALAARAIMMNSWVGFMSGQAYQVATRGMDGMTAATPLSAAAETFSIGQLFLGNISGCIGEVSKICLLAGGIYLLVRKIISWRTPVFAFATLFICYVLATGSAYTGLYQLLSGGLFIGAVFMATDYSTSPATPLGKIIMGIGVGLITFVIREFSSLPEGCSYAILIMNLAAPLIERFTAPKVYGEVKKHA